MLFDAAESEDGMTDIIYQPAGRAREYAEWALNIYRGCDHGCTYCYAPDVLRMERAEFYQPKPRGGDFFAKLEKEAAAIGQPPAPASLFDTTPPVARGGQVTPRQVLFCFTCDPYCRLDEELQHTRQAIEILHRHGLTVNVLTKGGPRALRDLDLLTPRDTFGTTLTFLNPLKSLKWEPQAALPADRIETLQAVHAAGIPTWVSLEPVLIAEETLEIIRTCHTFVDLWKVGTLNHDAHAATVNWYTFARNVVRLLNEVNATYVIKDDLKKYLPA